MRSNRRCSGGVRSMPRLQRPVAAMARTKATDKRALVSLIETAGAIARRVRRSGEPGVGLAAEAARPELNDSSRRPDLAEGRTSRALACAIIGSARGRPPATVRIRSTVWYPPKISPVGLSTEQGSCASNPIAQSRRSAGTLPPFSDSFLMTALCSQTFIVAESLVSPV